MNIEKYEKFELEDFVEDDCFRHWVMDPKEEENRQWQKFIEKHPEKVEIIEQAKVLVIGLYEHFETEIKNIPQQQAQRSLQIVSQRLFPTRPMRSLKRRLIIWSAVAASILLLSLGGYWIIDQNQSLITYSTGNGQRMNILLPDSSHIQLNANSTLSYSPRNWWSKSLREVNLKGEAYFKVTKKADGTKFVVHSGDVDIKVLGTAFNVRSRGENSEVVLAEGVIELQIANQKIAMQPGDFVHYSKAQRKVESKKVKASDYTAWKDGIIVFNNSLREVAAELEILYGIKFNIEKEGLKDRLIQLSAPADSLKQVLEILEIMYSEEINIQLEDKQVRIY